MVSYEAKHISKAAIRGTVAFFFSQVDIVKVFPYLSPYCYLFLFHLPHPTAPSMFYRFYFKLLLLLPTSLAITYTAPVAETNSPSLEQCKASMIGDLPDIIPTDFHYSGQIRRYYIAAERETWDYFPSGWDNWLGVPLSISPRARLAGYTASRFPWNQMAKSLYRGYTDATFTTRTPQPATQGIKGPYSPRRGRRHDRNPFHQQASPRLCLHVLNGPGLLRTQRRLSLPQLHFSRQS